MKIDRVGGGLCSRLYVQPSRTLESVNSGENKNRLRRSRAIVWMQTTPVRDFERRIIVKQNACHPPSRLAARRLSIGWVSKAPFLSPNCFVSRPGQAADFPFRRETAKENPTVSQLHSTLVTPRPARRASRSPPIWTEKHVFGENCDHVARADSAIQHVATTCVHDR